MFKLDRRLQAVFYVKKQINTTKHRQKSTTLVKHYRLQSPTKKVNKI